MSHEPGKSDRVWALMQDIKIAMVVTHDGHGDHLRARPMAARPNADEHAIFFLTDSSAAKDEEVARNANVCLAFADIKGQKFVSVTGAAEVSNDRKRIKEIFSIADKAFWKDAEDPAVRLLTVKPTMAEYWEGPGLVVSFVKMIGAALKGGDPDLGDNKKVELSGALHR
jgi:general stress protein 26